MKNYTIPAAYDTLNDDQKLAFDMLKYGIDSAQNYFLTGNAGVGKSYLIDVYTAFCKANGLNILKAAPTGTAATNIKGVTLHKLFYLPPTIVSKQVTDRQLSNIHFLIAYADVIFIDEISMFRIDMFENVMNQIKMANKIRANKNKQPIQIILSGDFGQLPPVITKNDRELYKSTYGSDIKSGRCYESTEWAALGFQPIVLREQMRQGDTAFRNALDNIRIGVKSDMAYINQNSAQSEIQDGIWLCGYKDTAAEKNALGLYKLPGEIRKSHAIVTGKAKISQTNMAEELIYKIGARVMMIMNKGSQYSNGSLGTIIDETINGDIMIRLDRGYTIMVEKTPVIFYEYKAQNGRVEAVEVGKIIQYPFKIGYAVTIHKSQGQTYDSMNLVPEVFAVGQLYTAISRCKSLSNIYIQPDHNGDKLTDNKFMADKDVVMFLIDQDGKAQQYKNWFLSNVRGIA